MNTCKKIWPSRLIAGLAILFFLTAAAPAQTLDAPTKAAVIQKIIDKLNEYYVFPDMAKKMEKHLRKKLKKGAYKTVNQPAEFASILTEDLRDICHDLHLRVRYYPEPPPTRPDSPPDPEKISRQLNFINHAFQKVERLAGNIGYLKFKNFLPAEYGGATAVAALNFLAHTDALIIDLRQNTGGSPSMIQLINSYFFDKPTHLNSFYIRKGDKTRQFWTAAHVQGKRMTDTPIYVLTSKRTFSAAEEFTYNLKSLERGTIVGETTGGGAHPVRAHYFEEYQFGVGIPYGRAVNPVTGTNWEGKGVKPHHEVPQEEALDKAYRLALKDLVKNTEDKEKREALERDLNTAGYRLLGQKKVKEAIDMFKLNVELFPESSNTYDSLGEAYMEDNNTELAVKNYEKSLELDPKNQNAVKMLKKLKNAKVD